MASSMLPPLALGQGQYGGSQTPAVTTPGGAALASNLGSAALGMLTGGGSVALDAAMKAAGDSSTTVQTPTTNIGPQSTGSKVFNLTSAQGAVNANPFWQTIVGPNSSILPIVIVGAIAVAVFYFVLRRK